MPSKYALTISREVADEASYKLFIDELAEEFGEEVRVILDLMAHGYSKRKIAKILRKPYPKIKEQVLKIREYLGGIREEIKG